jgi:hypothetical protein
MSLFKPIAVFSTIAGFALYQQAAAQYSIDLPYKQVSVENRNGKAVFNGASLTGEPGKPNLPSYVISILLPPEVDFKDVTVKLIDPVYEELNETFDVDPPVLFKDPVWPDSTKIVEGKDTSVYRKNAFSPVSFKGSTHFDQLWQYKVANVTVYPYRYNPVQKKLRKLTGGVIEASFKINKTTSSTVTSMRLARAEKELSEMIANPQVLGTYGSAPLAQFQMLAGKALPLAATNYAIITTNAIYTGQTQIRIDEYVNHLTTDDGYTGDVRIVTEGATQGPNTWVAASDAESRALNIRAWLTTYVVTDDWNVLLIGNPSPLDGDVPMKLMHPGASCWGTDYYYGDLNATWGDEDAILQEIPVGRIPVYGTADFTRLNDFLQKTKDYKRATNVEWRRFALIPIVPCFAVSRKDFDLGDLRVKAKLDPSGWECRRLYEPYSFTDELKDIHPAVANAEPLVEVPHCNYGVVVNNWNTYTPGLVVWHTHGSATTAAGILHTGAVPSLNNNYPAIVFSGSCWTSHAQTAGNLGTEMIYGNAIAYVGGTEDLYGGEDGQIHCDVSLFVEKIRDNESVGDAVKAIQHLADFKTDNKRIALYGCPEVRINLPNTPQIVPGPQTLSATWISNSRIDLNWSAVPDAQMYIIERALQAPYRKRPEGWSVIDQVIGAPPATTYSDVSVTADNVYLYRVRANTIGSRSGYSPVDSVSTFSTSLLPQVVSNLQVTPDCYTAIVSWDLPATVQPGTSYNIKRRHVNSGTPCAFVTAENTFLAPDVSFQEAEDASLSGSASFNNNHPNFSGRGFIDGLYNSSTAAVEFNIDVACDGVYTVNLFYSAGAGTSTNMGLYVNGVKMKDITCPGTSNWDTWGTQSETVTLTSGSNTIKY